MASKRTTAAKHLTKAGDALRKWALAYPEAYEEFPWGHTAVKVKGKAFLFLGYENGALGLSVKLPFSGAAALSLPFASPTAYGLGKSGWVSAKFSGEDEVPIDLLGSWIEESYQAIAPKRLVAQLAAPDEPEQPARAKRRK
jgi:predicted DNA-binding protein (MmcQ/YjbR family)